MASYARLDADETGARLSLTCQGSLLKFMIYRIYLFIYYKIYNKKIEISSLHFA